MAALPHAHSLVNAVLGPLGLQLARKSARMPDAPELLPRLLSDCPVLASRERVDLLDTRWMVKNLRARENVLGAIALAAAVAFAQHRPY